MFHVRQPISTTKKRLYSVLSVIIIISIYSFLSYRQHQINPTDTVVPNFSQFVDGFNKIILPRRGEIWLLEDLKATYTKHFFGMVIGVILSLTVGLAMGCYASIAAFFEGPISFFSQIPPTAMMAIYLVVFGFDIELYIAMVALGVFPTLTRTVYLSVIGDVAENAIYKAYTLGASTPEVIFHIIFRQILPRFIDAIRMTVGPALVILIAVEWAAADVGFGYRLKIQSRLLNMNVVYLYLIILGILGYGINYSLVLIRKKLCPWFIKD